MKNLSVSRLAVLLIACILSAPFALSAQKEANNWYFGYHCGLTFANGTPQVAPESEMVTLEGCASWSDSEGNLLFYTNGGGLSENYFAFPPDPLSAAHEGAIWNKQHQVMYAIPATEGGSASAPQGALILPVPGSDHLFYLFTVDRFQGSQTQGGTTTNPGRGLRYYIVDMSLNGGLGGVTVANQPVYNAPANMRPPQERLTVIKHANCTDYWLITTQGANFVVVQVTEQGIRPPIFQPIPINFAEYAVVLKASPDGNYLAFEYGIYEFNRSTGAITLKANLLPSPDPQQFDYFLYSFSFSPNSRYLYSVPFFSVFMPGTFPLYRYDLTTPDVVASRSKIAEVDISHISGIMQIGPDGNIYHCVQHNADANAGKISIARIKNPDNDSPVYEPSVISFSDFNPEYGNHSWWGLPNYPDWLFDASGGENGTVMVYDTVLVCPGQDTVLKGPSGYSQYQWSTGANTVNISVQNPGDYTLEAEKSCKNYIYHYAVISASPHEVSITANPEASCPGDTIFLTAVTDYSNFIWSNGAHESTIPVTEAGVYSVSSTDGCTTEAADITVQFDGDCCKVEIPNAFTPNGDGSNDFFSPLFFQCNVVYYHLTIYDRWGEMVFETYQAGEAWNGAIQQKEASSDVYVYHLVYETKQAGISNGPVSKVGNLSLLR